LPREKHFAAVSGEHRFAQVSAGIDVVQLRRLEQGIEERRDLGATLRLRAVVVLPADDGAADSAFCAVVVQGHEWVVDKASETVPVRDRVRGGFADGKRLQRRLTPQLD
jgi:hypothetical protein